MGFFSCKIENLKNFFEKTQFNRNLQSPKPVANEKELKKVSQDLQKSKPINNNVPQKNLIKGLFEEFFVIGIEKEDIKLVGDSIEMSESRILYSYPDKLEDIKEFLFYFFH